jgi:PAS domain S-box-containing protein
VHEATYSLIPKELRAEAHLRIGMLLAEHTSPEKRGEAIFEIVNQLNRGSHIITSVEDRECVAELNLIAGKRAKLSTAYDSALGYLRAGRALLTEETWERSHQLIFSIEYLTAECELLNVTVCLAAGDPLAQVQKECENGLAFARRVRFGLVIERCEAQLGLILTLRGLTATFGCLDHEGYTELDTERRLANSPDLVLAEFHYWTRKLQAHFFAGDLASAVDASQHAEPLLWTSAAMFESAVYRLYAALTHAAAWDQATPEQRPKHFDSVLGHYRELQVWAEVNPETFEDRAALVGAEIARIEGRFLKAQELYEKAIREARKHGFVHNQAIANEIAGRFYAERGHEKIAVTYLRASRTCYLRWGAEGKVRQLEERYPQLKVDETMPDSAATIVTPVEQLDLATVIRVSEAVSGEIVFEKLINTLMSSAIEHAGANRGLLVLPRGDEYQIEAEATTSSDNVRVLLKQTPVTAADLPLSIFHYVHRTKESVLLHDASSQKSFSADDYIREHRSRSVLCLPIVKQTRLIGILYLENNLSVAAFTPARMVVLTLLASQAAISIENASLYRDLAEREARIRRLVDANIIGVFFWDIQDRIVEANEAFSRIVGLDRTNLMSRGLRWIDLTAAHWCEHQPELKVQGTLQPFETELFREDGSVVPVLIGMATFEQGSYQGVAFVLDLTERKRAGDALRALQADLAHANRVATMGQLAGSIAHEVNQPIGAVRNNAHAALRFLAADPPNVPEVRGALECVVGESYRAGNIIARIRDQMKKAPPHMESMDLNKAVEEVLALVKGELSKNGISVHVHTAERLSPVKGDRVQLQQVMLNLILNSIEAMTSTDGSDRKLEITTESHQMDGLLVAVADSGPGVPANDLERIFESFYTTKGSGVGIGLSICRSIIDAHGGRLWAEAHQPGGVVFRFTLPAHN